MLKINQKFPSKLSSIIPAITFALASFVVTVSLNIVLLRLDYVGATKYSAIACLLPAILGATLGNKIFTDPRMCVSKSFLLGTFIGFVSNLVCVGVFFIHMLSQAKSGLAFIVLLFGASAPVFAYGVGVYGVPIATLSGLLSMVLYCIRRKVVS